MQHLLFSFPPLLHYRILCAENACSLSHNPTLFCFNGTLRSCSVPESQGNNLFEPIIILPSSKNCFGQLQLQLLFSSSTAIIAKCSLFPFPGQWPSHVRLCDLSKRKVYAGAERVFHSAHFLKHRKRQKASNQKLASSPVV